MSGDLGADPREVHEKARAVLDFWFGEVGPDRWFAQDAALDATISDRFRILQSDVTAGGAAGWRDDPETLLAAVIVLDQFSRHLHRGLPVAFASDPLAQELAKGAIAKGWDARLAPERRAFLYMPLMHAEDAALQAESVALYEALGDADHLKHARDHADVIARFGRFPARNAALNVKSTPEETAFLSQRDAG